MTNNKNTLIVVSGIGLFVLIASSTVLALNFQKNSSNSSSSSSISSSNSSSSTQVTAVGSENNTNYKDGSYSTKLSYSTPGGQELIQFTVELKDNNINSVTTSSQPKDGDSKNYQRRFQQGINGVVKGKKIDDVSISSVNGSSLTTKSFMDAIKNIKDQSKI